MQPALCERLFPAAWGLGAFPQPVCERRASNAGVGGVPGFGAYKASRHRRAARDPCLCALGTVPMHAVHVPVHHVQMRAMRTELRPT